jgi:hypothetical protein
MGLTLILTMHVLAVVRQETIHLKQLLAVYFLPGKINIVLGIVNIVINKSREGISIKK